MKQLSEKAASLDRSDALAAFRSEFHIPLHLGLPCVYFTGNSLGLQPKGVRAIMEDELDDWATYGVEGHFNARRPWVNYHEQLMQTGADLVGAKYGEVVHMNGLTANIHLLMVSFYRPAGKRFKILCEAKAFPSDQYALASQVQFHGYRPEEAIIEVHPRAGKHVIEEEDIESILRKQGDEIALVFFGGVNYYSGQVFDMERITRAAHAAGAVMGLDLAHAAGNVPLELHKWGVDFAAWCSYKYLNSGPGSVSGVFVHERHAQDHTLPRFAGWWGHNKKDRFKMEPQFDPMPGAEGWQLSNAPVFAMAPHIASLELFSRAGMHRLRQKSIQLTAYLEEVIGAVAQTTGAHLEMITPSKPQRRGCQISLLVHGFGREIFNHLMENGVYVDWREPNVIRMAPVPLYNSFQDVFRFGIVLRQGVELLKEVPR